ncbi:outer membrane immunogenic protein [Agrobacterium vitis]|nr:outer membrane immunogenic protein [Agrobacterium vitis]MBE1438529.1 outer membrane immunogenic protein [Agrobacterium vitis]
MRNLTMILLASATSLSLISGAHAADAVMQIPEAPAAMDNVAPVSNWSGAYVGGTGDYNMGRFRGGDFNARAFGGGLYGGYNMQNDKIVYGAEADIGYSGYDGSAGNGLKGRQGINGSVRGRVGYDLNPVLVYGTAGLAAANTKMSGPGGSDSKAALGYTIGAGAEAMVTNNITTRVEYRYTDYQSKDYNVGNTSARRAFEDQSVKVGIGMKF